MANFTLTQNATNVNNAINNVHNAQTTPTNGSATMVTSGGVYTAINNLTTANLTAATLVTQAEGIASNDNETTLPTSAAVKDFVDTKFNLVPIPAIVTTFTARNGEEQRYFKNLSEVTDPNSIISINSGQEIQFASTGTYLVKAGVNIDDNDSDTGDEYNAVLVPTHGSTTPITFGGAPMRSMEIRAGANTGVCTTFTFAYVVSNTTTDRLAIYVEPISSASAIQWEGAAVVEITKLA